MCQISLVQLFFEPFPLLFSKFQNNGGRDIAFNTMTTRHLTQPPSPNLFKLNLFFSFATVCSWRLIYLTSEMQQKSSKFKIKVTG